MLLPGGTGDDQHRFARSAERPGLVNDPYAYFEHMRKTAPVWRGTLMESDLMPPELKVAENWTLFDFESVFAAFREDTVFGSEMYNNTIGLVFGPTILGMHGKQHHDHRSLVSQGVQAERARRSGNPR